MRAVLWFSAEKDGFKLVSDLFVVRLTMQKADTEASKLRLGWIHLGKVWREFWSCLVTEDQYRGSCSCSSVSGGVGVHRMLSWTPTQ